MFEDGVNVCEEGAGKKDMLEEPSLCPGESCGPSATGTCWRCRRGKKGKIKEPYGTMKNP